MTLRDYKANAVADPAGPTEGASRALRGGSWFDCAGRARAAYRGRDEREDRFGNFGFRCLSVRP